MARSPYKSLIKEIRNDDYLHWQTHVRKWEEKQKEPLTVGLREDVGKAVYDAVLHHAVANLHFEPEELDALQRVQDYFELPSDVIATIKRPYAPKALKMLAEWFLTDGILTGSERAQLLEFGQQMCLTKNEVEELVAALHPQLAQ